MPEYLNRKNERIKRVGEYLTKYITSKGLHENRKVILEIGCGHGHWLSSFAAKNKDIINFMRILSTCLVRLTATNTSIKNENSKKHY